jgi:hypothetical protein
MGRSKECKILGFSAFFEGGVVVTCSVCGGKGHTKATCLKVHGIELKWQGFNSFTSFKNAQEHLVPKHYRSRKKSQRVGPCQGWYALSSDRGVHYIGLVGEWRTKDQRKGKPAGQSTNTFYRRWIRDPNSHDSKGGFGTYGQNGTWPKEALQQGKLLGKNKCKLNLAPVDVVNITYRKSGKKPNFCEPGREQANLITSVEQYLIHRYANQNPSRKTSGGDARKSIMTSAYAIRKGLKKDINSLFNQDNKDNINIRLYNSTVRSSGLTSMAEVNQPRLTMHAYQRNPAAIMSNKTTIKKSTKKSPPLGSETNPYPNMTKAKNGRNSPAYYCYRGNKNDIRELKR